MPKQPLRVINGDKEGLRALYDQYVQYLADLGHQRGSPYPPRKFTDFEDWWWGLPADQRDSLEDSFGKGLTAILAEGRCEVAEVLKRRKKA